LLQDNSLWVKRTTSRQIDAPKTGGKAMSRASVTMSPSRAFTETRGRLEAAMAAVAVKGGGGEGSRPGREG
jgi:hypothetical protein